MIDNKIIIISIFLMLIVIFIVLYLMIKYFEMVNNRIVDNFRIIEEKHNKYKKEQSLLLKQIFIKLKNIKDKKSNIDLPLDPNMLMKENANKKSNIGLSLCSDNSIKENNNFKNNVLTMIQDFKDYVKIIVNYIDKKVDDNNNETLLLNKTIKTIDLYFNFFISLNIEESVFHSIFYIKDEDRDIYIGNDSHLIYEVLCKFFPKYFDSNELDILKIKKTYKDNQSNELLNYYGLKTYYIDDIIKSIKSEKINFIDIDLFEKSIYEKKIHFNNFKLINETQYEYELRLLLKVKLYFEKLYVLYQKYVHYGIKFNN